VLNSTNKIPGLNAKDEKTRKEKTLRVDCDRKSPAWRPKKKKIKKNNKAQ